MVASTSIGGQKASETLDQAVTHDEKSHVAKTLSSEAAAAGQGISGYETLTVWETCMKFKYNSVVCSMMAFAAAMDGYQIGFVNHPHISMP